MYLLSKNPVKKEIGKTMNKAAICGLRTINIKSTFCFAKMKLYMTKYRQESNKRLLPPQTAYLYVFSGKSGLNKK